MDEQHHIVSADETTVTFGADIGLTNKDPTLRQIRAAAGWDVRSKEGVAPDLDLSCFLLNKDGRTRWDEDFVFYNNIRSEDGEVVHKGDSRTGAGDGDDETIEISLQALSYDVMELEFVLTIHEGEFHDQSFAQAKNVYFRLVNMETEMELIRFPIPDEHMEQNKGTLIRIGKLFRDGDKWRFITNGLIEENGLRKAATGYGIIVI